MCVCMVRIRLVSIVCCVLFGAWMDDECLCRTGHNKQEYLQYIVQCEFYYVGFGISTDLTRTGGRWRCWFYLFLASIFPYTCTHIVNYVFILFSYFLWPSSQNGMFNSIAMPNIHSFFCVFCFYFCVFLNLKVPFKRSLIYYHMHCYVPLIINHNNSKLLWTKTLTDTEKKSITTLTSNNN